MSVVQGLAGRLVYRRRSTGEERGREDFQLTRHLDGSRTLRCLARTDDSRFLRDAITTINASGRPVEAFIRLQVADRWIGSGYFRTLGEALRVVVDREGRSIDQRECVPERFHIMTHAVMHDGWTFWSYDEARGGEQELVVYNTSQRWDGTEGPDGRLETLTAERVASDEVVETSVGRFEASRYRLVSAAIGSPPCELRVATDDRLLVLYDWPELDLTYRLERLEAL